MRPEHSDKDPAVAVPGGITCDCGEVYHAVSSYQRHLKAYSGLTKEEIAAVNAAFREYYGFELTGANCALARPEQPRSSQQVGARKRVSRGFFTPASKKLLLYSLGVLQPDLTFKPPTGISNERIEWGMIRGGQEFRELYDSVLLSTNGSKSRANKKIWTCLHPKKQPPSSDDSSGTDAVKAKKKTK